MKKNKITVQKIPNCYVGEDHAQVTISFTNSILIHEGYSFMTNDIICSYNMNDKRVNIVNKYLRDTRKNKFPYSDIPLHISLEELNKIYHINQIFDLKKDYWCIIDYNMSEIGLEDNKKSNGYVIYMYLLKDNNDILLVSEHYDLNIYDSFNCIKEEIPRKKYTIEEIEHLLSSKDGRKLVKK